MDIAVKKAITKSSIQDKESAIESYIAAVSGKSNTEAREIASDILGENVFWDWDREEICSFSCHFSDATQYLEHVRATITLLAE
jgi:hypothetical protein